MEAGVDSTASTSERRRWNRLPIAIPFFVRGPDSPEGRYLEFATALNVSAGGVLLVTRRYLDAGTQITLEVPVSLAAKAQLPHPVSSLQATVLRTVRTPSHFLTGVQFAVPLTQ
jgi:hypothetical protein